MKFTVIQLRTLVACGLTLFASEATVAKPITDLPKALAAAKAQGKPIFIYVFDSVCGRHCRVLDQNPNANRAFAKLANQFIVANLDTRNGRSAFVKRLKVGRNRTYALVLKPEGCEISRMKNPRTLEEIIILLKQAVPQPAPTE